MLSLRPLRMLGWAVVLLGCTFISAPAWADGFIIIERPVGVIWPGPRPMPPRLIHFPLEVKNHFVTCAIRDTIGITKVDQTFHNPNPQQMEGTYMFPLPETAAVQKFSMWMNGKETRGELLDADKARQIYEDIVRRTKDPGLLEYVGQRLYKARVFPIPGNGDVRIALEYTETIPISDGQATYRYPLNTEKYSAKPIEDVTITVELKSQVAIKSVSCPSHNATVSRPGEKEAKVGFEAHHVKPDSDFIVNYLLSDKEFGLSLLTHKPPGEDGYFLARLSPPFSASLDKVVPKDVVFVLDTSGSMAGEKIGQARKALLFCLSSLRREDRFNLVTFATDVRPFKDSLVDANPDNVAAAKAEVQKIEAAGGTAINEALEAALKVGQGRSGDRPYMIVFITDGEPTVGEREPEKIIANVKRKNEGKARLFVFGVGHDLNAKLLDRLGDENRGAREYIDEKEDIEVKVSAFFKKISDPVLSDIELNFEGAESLDVYPKNLSDLFHGSELVVVGRYRGTGKHNVVLGGRRAGETLTWSFPGSFAESAGEHDFLPRLWAARKIGYLMDEIRLHGEKSELKEEIVKLAKRHAIITPYTSYLVVEDAEMRVAAGRPAAEGQALSDMLLRHSVDSDFRMQMDRARGGERAERGKAAVDASRLGSSLREAKPNDITAGSSRRGGFGGFGLPAVASPASPPGAAGRQDADGDESPVKQVAGKTFYQDPNGRWVDSEYDSKAETKKTKAFSDEYFQLLRSKPELGKYLALGEKLVVVLNKIAYEIQ